MIAEPQSQQETDRNARSAFEAGSYASHRYATGIEQGDDYFARLARRKLECVSPMAKSARLLDLCCGEGGYLEGFSDAHLKVGADFNLTALRQATRKDGTSLIACNARALPFADASFDVVYSLASLYLVPNLEEVFSEIFRVLAPGGMAVLDLGNRLSLNALVCKNEPDLLPLSALTVAQTHDALRRAGLTIRSHRAFQILPFWGNGPRWLRPLLARFWPRLFAMRVGGRMLDEWISNIPLLSLCAFRHIFVCGKQT